MKTTQMPVFQSRVDAGRKLAERLSRFARDEDVLILALPRGGVPVAAEISRALNRPFDVLVVRKLGVPGHEEFAMGAIAAGGVRLLDEPLIAELGLSRTQVDEVVRKEATELSRRERAFRSGRGPLDVVGRTVIVIDDGIATGFTMFAAIRLLRQLHARRVVVAVPVAPPDTIRRLRKEADEVVVIEEPEPFRAVGCWYEDFAQTTDTEVSALLADAPPLKPIQRSASEREALDAIRDAAVPLAGPAGDFRQLVDFLGDASIVLLGEASHGTHEFYRARAEITKRLIIGKGFNAVAVEADWPDAYRVNRFVRGESMDMDAVDSLAGFTRFPAWMWRNADVLDFIGWLRDHNERVASEEDEAGFYGIDLYSLHKSMNEVIAYLAKVDPAGAARARIRYGCINRFGPDPQNYGLLSGSGVGESCRAQVVEQLANLRVMEAEYLGREGSSAVDEYFFAKQNARLVKNAEAYYRRMFHSDTSSWNLRDEHMMETLVELVAHLQNRMGKARVVVWAHNSHLGDARATAMSRRGEWNIGQLVREAFPDQCRLVGFTTYAGTVAAAAGWHLPVERMQVLPGLEGSYERLFHEAGVPCFWLDLTGENAAARTLRSPRLERAIGVVYRPDTERQSHYFEASLAAQFDAVVHFDLTRAVEPLERGAEWARDEAPETYPVGI